MVITKIWFSAVSGNPTVACVAEPLPGAAVLGDWQAVQLNADPGFPHTQDEIVLSALASSAGPTGLNIRCGEEDGQTQWRALRMTAIKGGALKTAQTLG